MNEVVLKVGGEGGSVALYGLRSTTDWQFSLDLIDPAAASSGQIPDSGVGIVVSSWPDALKLLDTYPWHRLTPILVHPEFRADILDALIVRYTSADGDRSPVPNEWERLCIGSHDSSALEDLSMYQTIKAVHSSDGFLYDEVERPETKEERETFRDKLVKLGLSEEAAKKLSGG